MVVNRSSAYIAIATCCKWLLTYVKHKGGILWVRTKHTIFGSFFHHKKDTIFTPRIWETPLPQCNGGLRTKIMPPVFCTSVYYCLTCSPVNTFSKLRKIRTFHFLPITRKLSRYFWLPEKIKNGGWSKGKTGDESCVFWVCAVYTKFFMFLFLLP